MYSVHRLSFPEGRPYENLTFPLFRPWLRTADPDLIALGASLGSSPAGLLLARAAVDEPRVGEIHSIFVTPDQRRVGIASRMLAQAEHEFRVQMKLAARITYMDGGPFTPALEGLLTKFDWGPPSPRMLICESDFETITQAPWMELREFPPEYEVFPWIALTAAEREELLHPAAPWFPDLLTPFWYEERIEPVSSLGLRWRGKVVGWCITHREKKDTIRFVRLFVRRELQATSRAIMLLAQSIYRHQHTEVDKAIFDVASHNEAMLRFVRRRMAPYLKSMRMIQRRVKRFAAPMAQGIPA